MSKTLTVNLSDAEIRRHVDNPNVRDLRDARQPTLRLRFKQDRNRASWYLVLGSTWHKIANFLTCLPRTCWQCSRRSDCGLPVTPRLA